MDEFKPFSETKSLYTKWYKHELTGKTLPNGIGMMEKVADKAKDKHWLKLSDLNKEILSIDEINDENINDDDILGLAIPL